MVSKQVWRKRIWPYYKDSPGRIRQGSEITYLSLSHTTTQRTRHGPLRWERTPSLGRCRSRPGRMRCGLTELAIEGQVEFEHVDGGLA